MNIALRGVRCVSVYCILLVFPALLVSQEVVELSGGAKITSYTIKKKKGDYLKEEVAVRYESGNRTENSVEILILGQMNLDSIPEEQLPIFQNRRHLRHIELVDNQKDAIESIRVEFAEEFRKAFRDNVATTAGLSEAGEKIVSDHMLSKLEKAQELAFEILLPHQKTTFETTMFKNEYRRRENRVLLTETAALKIALAATQKSQIEAAIVDSERQRKLIQDELTSNIQKLKQETETIILSKLDTSQREFFEEKMKSARD